MSLARRMQARLAAAHPGVFFKSLVATLEENLDTILASLVEIAQSERSKPSDRLKAIEMLVEWGGGPTAVREMMKRLAKGDAEEAPEEDEEEGDPAEHFRTVRKRKRRATEAA